MPSEHIVFPTSTEHYIYAKQLEVQPLLSLTFFYVFAKVTACHTSGVYGVK